MAADVFNVPPAYRRALTSLASLPDDVATAIGDAVASLPAFSPVAAIEEAARGAAGTQDDDWNELIVPALLSLRGQVRSLPVEEIADAISRSIGLSDEDVRDRLSARLQRILDTPAVSTTAIGVDVQTRHERNYQSARIFTDIRPVFQDDVASPPSGAVIVEMLEIQTWDRDGTSQSIYIAMDERDLHQLEGTVTRALGKTATLKQLLAQLNLPYFQLNREED